MILFAIATAALALLHQFTCDFRRDADRRNGVDDRDVDIQRVCADWRLRDWLRARALAYYLLVFQGAMAIGSGVWGEVARWVGVRASLNIAAAAMVAGLAAGWKMKLSAGSVAARVEPVAARIGLCRMNRNF